MKKEIKQLFDTIEITNSFVQYDDDIGKEADKIAIRIQSQILELMLLVG